MNTVERKSITINGATYTITSEGEVYGAYGQPIKLRPDTCGYATFTAGRKGHRTRVSVHRLVAELFTYMVCLIIRNKLSMTQSVKR